MPDFFDVVSTMRAHRAFTDDPISDETILKILEAATWAPSAENMQPWEFIVVRDPELRAAIGELTKRAWETNGRDFSKDRLAPGLFEAVDKGATGGVSAAPVLIVAAADTSRSHPKTIPASMFPAIQNLLLAAHAEGFGSALTTLSLGFAKEIRELLNLPDHVEPIAVLPLGVPAKELGPPRRLPVAGKTHWDRYSAPSD
jgi:nitroreductase